MSASDANNAVVVTQNLSSANVKAQPVKAGLSYGCGVRPQWKGKALPGDKSQPEVTGWCSHPAEETIHHLPWKGINYFYSQRLSFVLWKFARATVGVPGGINCNRFPWEPSRPNGCLVSPDNSLPGGVL